MPQFLSDLDLNSVAKITNLPDPTLAQHAATKAYVDSAIEGLNWKDSCRVSTQGNLSIASPGATIDGITMVAGDRVLYRSQTTASENGIYIWNGAATPATRAADMSAAAEFEQAVTMVEEGTDAQSGFRQTAVNVTVGSTSIVWGAFGASVPAASTTTSGIAELATQGEVDAGSDALRIVTPATLAAHSGRKLKYAADFGDGSATQYDITHNLGTYDVQVQVHRNSGNRDTVQCDIGRQSTNAVRLNFITAPTSNQFRVVILG